MENEEGERRGSDRGKLSGDPHQVPLVCSHATSPRWMQTPHIHFRPNDGENGSQTK